ncbi:MAG: acyl-CoA thioesterase [Phycisphaerales bacterium]|nr:acyl-CoA thioesterase [Phycisphaerales bacterium]MCB9856265.1 acyl-CoA thioesterase [Phycisphaerales bacterium]MCB9863296.1 acyl-CoA thioesterase [Phycisphaerales bacterium]
MSETNVEANDSRTPAIRVMMMPRDTNAHGTIFGGVLLSYVDQAGAIEARKLGCARVVTVAMDSVEFKHPVFVGDVLSFYAEVIKVGRTSARIRVSVEAERFEPPCEHEPVTTADLVYVAIDEHRKAIPFAECRIRDAAEAAKKRK